MPRVLFDDVRELLLGVLSFVSSLDDLHTAAHFFNRTSTVFVAEIHVQRSWCNQTSDVGRVRLRIDSRNEIRKAVKQLVLVDASVRWQATIADKRF